MSGCRSRQDLTFQYPCSLRFPLPPGGTERARFPSRSGGNLQELTRVRRFGTESLQQGLFFPAQA
jgi:hypothetical protein